MSRCLGCIQLSAGYERPRPAHRWASDDPHRRFDDLYNLVCDPAFVLVAWDRVRHNKGARSAGVDGRTAYAIEAEIGVEAFCDRTKDLQLRGLRLVTAAASCGMPEA